MNSPSLWSGGYHIQCSLHLSAIVKTKPLDTLFVVILRSEEFSPRSGMKNNQLHTHRRGRRAKTLADGIPRTRPL